MITKAIIPVAGYGTRWLPLTKAIEKCMLPICTRPIVDYTVEELILNGITDIYFVVSPDCAQLRKYYDHNKPLETYLKERGKFKELESVTAQADSVTFHYIEQKPDDPYGTAVPVWLARDAVAEDAHFVVMMGDDMLFSPEQPGANLRNMLRALETYQADSSLLAPTMPREKLQHYGVIQTRVGNGGAEFFKSMVEKPKPNEAVGNLVNASKYVLSQKIFPHIERVMEQPNERGEHFLIDAINSYAKDGNDMTVVRAVGQFLDGGNLAGWIEANNIVFEHLRQSTLAE